jgi:hypothetical protein
MADEATVCLAPGSSGHLCAPGRLIGEGGLGPGRAMLQYGTDGHLMIFPPPLQLARRPLPLRALRVSK